MLLPGGFQKFAGIPPGISRIFESLIHGTTDKC
jgi:hypothetical protein